MILLSFILFEASAMLNLINSFSKELDYLTQAMLFYSRQAPVLALACKYLI